MMAYSGAPVEFGEDEGDGEAVASYLDARAPLFARERRGTM